MAPVSTADGTARLALILRAKVIGSSLAEIKQYLDMYGQAGEGRQQQLRYVLARTDGAIAELEQKLAHIESSPGRAAHHQQQCCAEPRIAAAGTRLTSLSGLCPKRRQSVVRSALCFVSAVMVVVHNRVHRSLFDGARPPHPNGFPAMFRLRGVRPATDGPCQTWCRR